METKDIYLETQAVGNTDSLVNLYQKRYIQTVGKIDDNKIANSLGDFFSFYEKNCVSYHRQLKCVCVCVCVRARARVFIHIYYSDTLC